MNEVETVAPVPADESIAGRTYRARVDWTPPPRPGFLSHLWKAIRRAIQEWRHWDNPRFPAELAAAIKAACEADNDRERKAKAERNTVTPLHIAGGEAFLFDQVCGVCGGPLTNGCECAKCEAYTAPTWMSLIESAWRSKEGGLSIRELAGLSRGIPRTAAQIAYHLHMMKLVTLDPQEIQEMSNIQIELNRPPKANLAS